MAFDIKGPSGNIAEVTASHELSVSLTSVQDEAGYSVPVLEQDDGSLNGGTTRRVTWEGTQDYRGRVALDTNFFDEPFPGTALASGLWVATTSVMTVTVASGIALLNAGNSVASGSVARMQTWTNFPMYGSASTYVEIHSRLSSFQTNVVAELGVGYAATTATPSVGAYFKWDGANLSAVVNFNGVEDGVAIPPASAPLANEFAQYVVEWSNETVVFWIDNSEVVRYALPASSPTPTIVDRLPVLIRFYNANVVASAAQLAIGRVTVQLGETVYGYDSPARAAVAGRTLIQGQVNQTQGSTANWANSAAPAAATLSNTAAGYTTPGGQYIFNAPAGAETDYALFAFQNPAGTSAVRGQTLLIRYVRISAINIGAAVASTATVIQWGVGGDSSAVSLATAEAATTHTPRRLALGTQSWTVGAAIGTPSDAIEATFNPPISVNPGNFFHVIAKVFLGTATASQQIRGTVTVLGEYV